MTRAHTRAWQLLLLLVAVSALTAGAWLLQRAARPLELTLRFHPVVGAEPLVLGEARYANPGGAGRFAVRDFQMYLSNIRLTGPDGTYVEPDSYHLLRFDDAAGVFDIVLRDVPQANYASLEFGIGVDPDANGAITVRGELDPNGRMAWSWDVGYKFVLFEGTLMQGDAREPLVYHVGFDENYRVVATDIQSAQLRGDAVRLDFQVDVLQLFAGPPPVDMAALPTVKFDRTDAARLARNYGTLVVALPAAQR